MIKDTHTHTHTHTHADTHTHTHCVQAVGRPFCQFRQNLKNKSIWRKVSGDFFFVIFYENTTLYHSIMLGYFLLYYSCSGRINFDTNWQERSVIVRWVVGSIIHEVDPLSYVTFQPVVHDWCNKGRGMCYPVCGKMHIKEPLLLIGKNSPCDGSRFPLSLSEWSFTMCSISYNRK